MGCEIADGNFTYYQVKKKAESYGDWMKINGQSYLYFCDVLVRTVHISELSEAEIVITYGILEFLKAEKPTVTLTVNSKMEAIDKIQHNIVCIASSNVVGDKKLLWELSLVCGINKIMLNNKTIKEQSATKSKTLNKEISEQSVITANEKCIFKCIVKQIGLEDFEGIKQHDMVTVDKYTYYAQKMKQTVVKKDALTDPLIALLVLLWPTVIIAYAIAYCSQPAARQKFVFFGIIGRLRQARHPVVIPIIDECPMQEAAATIQPTE